MTGLAAIHNLVPISKHHDLQALIQSSHITDRHSAIQHLCSRHNTPSPHLAISITREQSLTIRTPRQRHTVRFLALLAFLDILGLQLVDLALLLEIEDGDG